jgi:dynein heavy chain
MRGIAEIEAELAKVQAQRDQLKREEYEAEQQVAKAKQIKEDCEETLNAILPSLKEALQLVSTLSKKDVAELRSLKHPPKVVKLVL